MNRLSGPWPHFGPFASLPCAAHLFSHAVDHFHVGPTGRIPPARAAPAFSSPFGGTGLSVTHRLPSWDPHFSCIFILISTNRFSPSLAFVAILRVRPEFTAWPGPWLSLSVCARGRSPVGCPAAETERTPQASFPSLERNPRVLRRRDLWPVVVALLPDA